MMRARFGQLIEFLSKLNIYFLNTLYMLWTIFIILLVLWALGLVTANVFGGFIHILLVIAVVVLLIRLIHGQKVL